jgi:lipopolysaccharide export system protein LptA
MFTGNVKVRQSTSRITKNKNIYYGVMQGNVTLRPVMDQGTQCDS